MEVSRKIQNIHPLTKLQEGMLYQQQVSESSGEYIVQFVYSTNVQIDPQNIIDALHVLSAKHEMLRARIAYRTVSQPVLIILKERMPEFIISDLTVSAAAEEEFNRIKAADVLRGFDLEKDTLLRATLVLFPHSEYRLIMSFHHIITDGWSNGIISKDFFKTYNALRNGIDATQLMRDVTAVGESDYSYSSYIDWLKQRDHEVSLTYWKALLSGYESTADILPSGQCTNTDDSVAIIDRTLSPVTTAKVVDLAKMCGVTLNVVVSAAFGIMLGRYSNTTDVVFGKVVSGREASVSGIDRMVGLFINTIVQRVCYSETTTVKQLINDLHTQAAESSMHDYIGLSEIQRLTPVGTNLVKTLFTFENYSEGGESSNEFIRQSNFSMINVREETNYNTSYVVYNDDVLHIKVMYKPEMFGVEELSDSVDRIIAVLESMVADPTSKIIDVNMLLPGEKERILKAAIGPSLKYPRATVVDLFVRQAAATPSAPVLTMKNMVMTYKQLDEFSDNLATQLVAMGAGKGKCVALIAARSMNMLVAIYGILKTGAAYVPIDPNNPTNRTISILTNCSPAAVVISGAQLPVSGIPTVNLDDPALLNSTEYPAKNLPSPDHLAYIIYTSGTTGTPKGVMINHSSLINYINYARNTYLDKDISIPLFTNYCFDLTVTSIFLGTCFGGVLDIIPPEDELNITEIVNSDKYSLIKMTPMHMKLCNETMNHKRLSRLKSFVIGGEALKAESAQRMLGLYGQQIAIHNEYGPTEATVGCCDYIYKPTDGGLYVSIGKPIANTQIYVLTGNTLCGFGIPGELCIAGSGVGLGYLSQEKLTAKHFIENPFGAGKLYRSGDCGRMFPDGALEYMGRIDDQVKIKGYRIELGEIENLIGQHIDSTNVCVIAREKYNEKQLHCYFAVPNKVDIGSLRDSLRAVMPEHLIPRYMMQIDRIPLNPNGKLDKAALPEIVHIESKSYIGPSDDAEKAVVAALSGLLRVEKVSMDDNFFHLGGDSIMAIRLVSKLRNAGYMTTVKNVITSTSIQALASTICVNSEDKLKAGAVNSTTPDEEISGYADYTPIIRKGMNYQLKKPSHFNMSFMLTSPSISIDALRASLDKLVRHHDMLRCVCRDGRLFIKKAEAANLYDISIHSLQDCKDSEIGCKIQEICAKMQGTINLETGPIVKVAVIKVKSAYHIMLTLHHIAADGVSLRILREDLESGYRQFAQKRSIRLESKTDSFIEWSEAIKAYEDNPTLRQEIPYWVDLSKKAVSIDFGTSSGKNNIRTSSVQLDTELTDDIIRKSASSYNLRVNDILLSVLALAIRYSTSYSSFSVLLEGHGRETIDSDVVVDRTVGWFTSQYPIILTTDGDIRNTLITTKEMLRRVPNNGIGYSILAYGHKARIDPCDPKILFNYLGDFSERLPFKSTFTQSPYSSGDDTDSDNIPDDELVINCIVRSGKLDVLATYNESHIPCSTVEGILSEFVECAQRVAAHCSTMTKTVPTGSDLGVGKMSTEVFNHICTQIDITNVEKMFRLSDLQQGMLYHALINEGDSSYFVQNILKLEPEYASLKLINDAFNCVVKSIETLRTRIVHEGLDTPYQVILKNVEAYADYHDLRSEKNCQDIFARLRYADIEKGFDFTKESLVRIAVVNMPDGTYMIWSIHHIIIDGWSSILLFNAFKHFLRRLAGKEDPKRLCDNFKVENAQKSQFSDYIAWLETRDNAASIAFWDSLLEGYEGIASFKPYGHKLSQQGVAHLRISATKKRTCAIKKLCAQSNTTMNTFVEAGLGILLQRFNNTDDVVFGKVVSGRTPDVADIDSIVGLLINTIPQRVCCKSNISVSELISMVQKQSAEATDHDAIGLAGIQSRSAVGKNLIKVILAFENAIFGESDRTIESVFTMVSNHEMTNYDISFVAYEENDILRLGAVYKKSKFTQQDIDLLLNRLLSILFEMSDNPGASVYDIGYSNENETSMILDRFNRTTVEYPHNKCIIELFEKQVDTHPLKNAVIFEEIQLTYSELNKRANCVARRLISMGVMPSDRVAIIAERCAESIAGICGILKAGAVYVPIDTSYPEERVHSILEDCRPKAVITINSQKSYSQYQVLNLAKCLSWTGNQPNLQINTHSSNPAYIIYTSGTTGKPKGVVVTHRNVIKLVKGADYTTLDRSTRILQTGQLAFDASTFEIWGCLLNGGLLHLISEATLLSPGKLKKHIVEQHINTMFITTALFNQLIFNDITIFDSLSHLLFGGEITAEDCVSRLHAHNKSLDLRNVYGPTETTTFATHYIVDCENEKTPIGQPISNTQIYILNQDKLCGIGTPGELCIAGDGVAEGYFEQPQLTSSMFIDNPYGMGKMYRSGDMARWLPDGNIEYIERIDNQVKIRGFRIELGEILNALRSVFYIKDAVIKTYTEDSGAKELCAYVVSDSHVNIPELKATLGTMLPHYMLPARFLQIDKIPLNSNGKVDKAMLPDIASQSNTTFTAPRTEAEMILCEIFASVLSVERIGIDDDFFMLGGHSLRATRVFNQIDERFNVRLALRELFGNPTVRSLAKVITGTDVSNYTPIPKAGSRKYYPMTSTQRRMFALWQMDKESIAYNMPLLLHIEGNVSKKRLRNALKAMLSRHEILRTKFLLINGGFMQQICGHGKEDFDHTTDLSTDKEELFKSLVRPFALDEANLVRIRLIGRLSGHLLFVDMHHIVADGMSISTFIEEFSALYNGFQLDPVKLQFKDYSEWIANCDQTAHSLYWHKVMSGDIPVLDMPLDFKRPHHQTNNGSTINIRTSKQLRDDLMVFAKQYSATEYMIFLAALTVLLSKYSRQEDIIIGTTFSGRTHKDTEKMMGMFVNTLAMRGYPAADKTCWKFIEETVQNCLRAYEHQEYPFDELIESLKIERDISRNPLFDVMLVYQNNDVASYNFSGLKVEPILGNESIAKFDLSFIISDTPVGYDISLEYCKDLFLPSTAQGIAEKLLYIIKQMIASPDASLGCLSTAPERERQTIINSFNRPLTPLPINATIQELFEGQVELNPSSTALIMGGELMTYSELNSKANVLANKLRADGITPNKIVALLTERSFEMIVAIIGVLKAGAAYLPIDPTYPQDRINFILNDSGAKAIIAYKTVPPKGLPIYDLADFSNMYARGNDQNPKPRNYTDDLAYCIYTSGTSGYPKGVLVPHKGVHNLAGYFQRHLGITTADRVLQFANYVFDASVWEMSMALLCGASLVLMPKELLLDTAKFKDYFAKKKVTAATLPPNYFLNLKGISPRLLITAGSEASEKVLERISDLTRYINAYGPTETTVCATCWEYDRASRTRTPIPIGSAIPNTQVFVLDGTELCGIGVPGELCIAGVGVATGYLNRSNLTAAKFIDNPFGEGTMYRSGDLARWNNDGQLIFMGRIDQQVKSRGYRIELGEIESKLRELAGIKAATVCAEDNGSGDNIIYAFYVAHEDIALPIVRTHLELSLPFYMIPSVLMRVENIPLNQSGKVDRASLLRQAKKAPTGGIQPSTPIEREIAAIFKEVLKLDHVSMDDNFLGLGGDSLRAITLVDRIKSKDHLISISDIMSAATIESLCRLMGAESAVSKSDDGLISFSNYNEIVEHIDVEYSQFSNSIVSSGVELIYPFTPVQRIMVFSGALVMDTALKIDFEVDVARLKRSFISLINAQGMLRTAVGKKNRKMQNKQYKPIDDAAISFINAAALSEGEKIKLDGYLRTLAKTRYKRLKRSIYNRVLYQIIVIKYADDNWMLYLPFNHLVFDMFSIDIFVTSLKRIYRNDGHPTGEHINQYNEYAQCILDGPRNIDYNGMRKLLLYDERLETIRSLNDVLKKNIVGVNFTIDISGANIRFDEEQLWNLSFYIFNRLCLFETKLEKFPFTTIIAQRRYGEKSFYNTIGCLADNISMYDTKDNFIDYRFVRKFMEQMSDHVVNSVGLQFGISGWLRYPSHGFKDAKRLGWKMITKLSKFNVPVFDHMGMLDLVQQDNDDDDGRGNVREFKKPIASILNVASIGCTGKTFYVAAFCTKGTGKAMHDFVQSEVDEYVKQLIPQKSVVS